MPPWSSGADAGPPGLRDGGSGFAVLGGRALLGLALACAAVVGLLALGPRPPMPAAVAIALLVATYRPYVAPTVSVRVAPKTSPPPA